MAHIHNSFDSQFGLQYAPDSFAIRLGNREIFICRDFRKRYYWVNPVIECSAGLQPGHLEILLFRRWLVILSKARY
ncbi:hypothetical protein [Noviherbaspirillum massiliense]|uniref:hypothetical protein n=1 Tax=Noviherbaspirillum massiliense TaxID=1465823 RepID=UPI0002ED453A|nr:hypothetical protein [Noviherbaspirillum massiliense]